MYWLLVLSPEVAGERAGGREVPRRSVTNDFPPVGRLLDHGNAVEVDSRIFHASEPHVGEEVVGNVEHLADREVLLPT